MEREWERVGGRERGMDGGSENVSGRMRMSETLSLVLDTSGHA